MAEFFHWKTKKIEKLKFGSNERKTVPVTIKEKEKGTIEHLVNDFQDELSTRLFVL